MNSEFTIAVHSLALLAHLPGHMASSELIAQNVCTHPARIRKIMGILRKNGFVKTKEGVGGGYMLACNPGEVTLAAIYRSMSTGTLKPHWCPGDPKEACLVSANMHDVMDQIFTEAELYYTKYLEQHTIQTVLDKIRQGKCREQDSQ